MTQTQNLKGFRRKAKIVTSLFPIQSKTTPWGELDNMTPPTKTLFIVDIKVRLLGFLWVPIWSECCDSSDEKRCEYLEDEAAKVLTKLMQK